MGEDVGESRTLFGDRNGYGDENRDEKRREKKWHS
jgi:hypothetical protein